MLKLEIPGDEYYDEKQEVFIQTKTTTLNLEHSLISVSLWEAKHKKAFLKTLPSDPDHSPEEYIDYIRCMTLNKNVPDEVYNRIGANELRKVLDYINDPMTATTFNDKNSPSGKRGRKTTSELIYYWMTVNNIPFECQKWHLNRLLTLIRVCNAEQAPAKKMSKKDIMAQNASLNKMRRAKHHTKG